MPKANSKCAQRIIHHPGTIRPEEQNVAICRATPIQNLLDDGLWHEFENGRLQTFRTLIDLIYLDICQTARAELFNQISVALYLLPTQSTATGNPKNRNAAAVGACWR